MADINLSFAVENGISLDDAVGIFTGTVDPSTGEAAPIGSLYLQQNGVLHQKIGPNDIDWIRFSQGLGEAVKISATDTTAGYLSQKLVVSSNLTKAVQDAGANETLLLDLANTGVAASTYRSVTVDAKGRVTAGTNPTTLSGYGITDAQPLDADLTSIAAQAGTGYLARTGTNTWATRSIAGTTNQINVTIGNGTTGNTTLSLPTTNFTIPGAQGVILPRGTTAQRVNTIATIRFNNDTGVLEYFNGTTWVALVASTGGTVTSVAATAPAAGITISGSPITSAGTLTFSLANDLAAVESLSTTGFAVRSAADAWVTRTLQGTADRISISNADGVTANPAVDIAATYAGQTSINTLGVVSTGTWQATTISTAFGGTGRTSIGSANQVLGVNTTSTGLEYKTIANGTGIGLSFTPGQIAINNTGVTSVAGTANQVNVSAASGAVTLSLPQNIATTSSPAFAAVTLAADPFLPMQAATKQYVDNAVQGLNAKQNVKAATTANTTLFGPQTIDGVSVNAGDRILVKNQAIDSENGIYVIPASAAEWVRADDQNTWAEVPSAFVFVQQGDTLSDTGWLCSSDAGGTIDIDAVTWVQFSAAGTVQAGTGLTKSGNTLSITNTGVTPGAGFNTFSVNAQGQILTASTQPYITGNQTITLQGDVAGAGTTLINTTLANTGVTAGTYKSVTVDSKGRVTAGTNPTTLAGYGITDAQALDSYLTSLSAVSTDGIVIRTGNTALTRSITAGSSRVSVVNGDGVAGNPTIDIVETNLVLNNISGTLSVEKGGTALTSVGTPNQFLATNTLGTAFQHRSFVAGSGITIDHADGTTTISAVNDGTVTSIEVTGSTGLSVSGSPITTAGTIALTLSTELQGLSSVAGLGIVSRTGSGSFVTRNLVSGAGTITVTNPDGVSGNFGVDLSNIGTAGTYTRVTTDNFGRVISGSTPTTLAGYGIVDAQPLNTYLTNVSSVPGPGLIVKSGNSALARSIVAGSSKITVLNGDGVGGNPTVDVGTLTLNSNLADVTVISPVVGQSLLWNGSTWYNGSVALKLYAENAVAEVTPVASGDNSVAIGSAATAQADDSVAIGPQSLARHAGVVQANGRFATQGDSQHGTYILRTSTINGVPGVEMFLDGVNGSERLRLTTDTTWVWTATIVAHRTDAEDHAGFELRGVVYCGASLNSITMLGSVTKQILARTDQTLDVSATVDTTQGSLKLTVKGATGKTIRWTAVVSTVEVTN